jgi:tetratricopeptide (TPR) repeat protein
VGRLDAALEQARHAYELDPTAPVLASNLANTYLLHGDDDQALRYSRLATELGLGIGSEGVEAMVAMQRGQWDAAKKFMLAQHSLPPELKPHVGEYVDAVADPAKRPAIVAAMRAVDPKVATQADLLQPYLQLGERDLAFKIIDESLQHDRLAWVHEWELTHAWSKDAAAFRHDPRFAELVKRIGLVDYWKQYGYPDHCSAGAGDVALVCS